VRWRPMPHVIDRAFLVVEAVTAAGEDLVEWH
jgi:hypothetical protein